MLTYGKANHYLQTEQYDKAIHEYETELSKTSDSHNIMLLANNLGYAYQLNGDYNNAAKYYHMSIEAWPERGYYSYSGLAGLNYRFGKTSEAVHYSTKAKNLVLSPRYYELEKMTAYGKDTVKRQILAQTDFYEMRMSFQALLNTYESGDYKKTKQLAEEFLSEKYQVSFGIAFSGNTIEGVDEGSIAQLNGLVKGDKLLTIDRKRVSGITAALDMISQYTDKYGDELLITILRNGREIPVVCRLSYPELDQARSILRDSSSRLAGFPGKTKKEERQGPWLKILEPGGARGLKIAARNAVKFVVLASGREGVKSVTVNGAACSSSEASELEKGMLPGKVRKYTGTVPLSPGKNSIVFAVADSRGMRKEEKIEIIGSTSQTVQSDRIYDHRVAVVVGINKYKTFTPLEFAVNDARSISDRLRQMGFDRVIEIYDRDATRARVMRVLGDELPATMGSNDALMVFFAGHGLTEQLAGGGQEGYIAPVDLDADNYRGTAISMSSIHALIKKYRAKHILFVFDSCYSGLGLKRSGSLGGTSDAFLQNASRQRAAQIITAGGKDEQAREDSKTGHGLFTKALLDSLNGRTVEPKSGFIVASDAAQFIRKKVSEKSNGEQNPAYGWLAGEGDFIFEAD
jgi:tetratricopeptide (TPR) repeat protein